MRIQFLAVSLLLLATICCLHCAAAQPAVPGLLPVTSQEAVQLPLSAIGQLSNGCTGFLIGPCHVSDLGGQEHCWGAPTLSGAIDADTQAAPRGCTQWIFQSVTAGSVLCTCLR